MCTCVALGAESLKHLSAVGTGSLASKTCDFTQDNEAEQLLLLVNGTICLSGVVQLGGEKCSLFSESFVLCPTQSGQHYIKHQIFKVHKQHADDAV